jgi:MFS family permease
MTRSLRGFCGGLSQRPLGGALFGIMGDKLGRQKALTILLMAIPTTLLGCLPTHDQWGWASAASLVFIRLLQGISVGGEFTGSISFLVEKAPGGKRGFYGSWTTFGVMGGMLLGSGVGALATSVLISEQIHQYGTAQLIPPKKRGSKMPPLFLFRFFSTLSLISETPLFFPYTFRASEVSSIFRWDSA